MALSDLRTGPLGDRYAELENDRRRIAEMQNQVLALRRENPDYNAYASWRASLDGPFNLQDVSSGMADFYGSPVPEDKPMPNRGGPGDGSLVGQMYDNYDWRTDQPSGIDSTQEFLNLFNRQGEGGSLTPPPGGLDGDANFPGDVYQGLVGDNTFDRNPQQGVDPGYGSGFQRAQTSGDMSNQELYDTQFANLLGQQNDFMNQQEQAQAIRAQNAQAEGTPFDSSTAFDWYAGVEGRGLPELFVYDSGYAAPRAELGAAGYNPAAKAGTDLVSGMTQEALKEAFAAQKAGTNAGTGGGGTTGSNNKVNPV